MKLQKVKLSELTPDPKNTRKHNKRNIEVIKESIKRFGQYRPFVVQKEGMIIRVGNGMYQAMKELGIEEGYAEVRDISEQEAITLSIVDNRSAELAEWDSEMLENVFMELEDEMKKKTGFDERRIKERAERVVKQRDLLEKIKNATEYMSVYSDVEKKYERIIEKLTKLRQNKPQVFRRNSLIIADGESGSEVVVLVDNNLKDVILEIERNIKDESETPLEILMENLYKL